MAKLTSREGTGHGELVPKHPSYQIGYAAGLHNAKLAGPWERGWKFRPRESSEFWWMGHWQALEDQNWQPESFS